jgi:hypothetical protein
MGVPSSDPSGDSSAGAVHESMADVLRTIVEGEPGIFPDPVARLMRTIGGWFGRRKGDDEQAPTDRSTDAGGTSPPPDGADHSGESR